MEDVKERLRKVFQIFKKNTPDGQRQPTQSEIKIAFRNVSNKTHRNWKFAFLKKNNKEEKEMLPFVTQYQPLLVYYKRSFHGRVESLTKPTTTFPFF